MAFLTLLLLMAGGAMAGEGGMMFAFLFALVMNGISYWFIGSGIIGYATPRSMASLITGSAFGLGLLVSGVSVLRRKELGVVFAPLLTLSLTAFFAHRLVQSGDFIPFGPMGALGLVAPILCVLPAKESL